MKFKLDENIGELGRDLLLAAGHDVSTIDDQGMSGVADENLYETCCIEGRALVTLDRDFGEVLRFPPHKTAGIVILSCRSRVSPQLILSRIKEFLALLTAVSLNGRLWIVEAGRLRIHESREAC